MSVDVVALTHTPMRISPAISPLKTGVYMIRNKVNGKIYVGSAATGFRNRWRMHIKCLAQGRHHSPRLQGAWNKYGADAFEFVVMATCHREWCIALEQIHLNRLRASDPDFGYNILPVAGSWLGGKHTDKTKDKMKAVWRKRGTTEAQLAASSKTAKIFLNDPEIRRRQIDGTRRYWENPNPDHVKKRNDAARSPEAIAKKIKAGTGRKMTQRTKDILSLANKNRVISNATRAKMRASSKIRFERPGEKERMREIAIIGATKNIDEKIELGRRVYASLKKDPATGRLMKSTTDKNAIS